MSEKERKDREEREEIKDRDERACRSVKPISILLSTYNGERYIDAQIESLLRQDMQEFEVYVHDDGSTDGTLDRVRGYEGAFGGRLHILDDEEKGRGAKGSFLWLMSHVESRYYMFCDQDDVWRADKVRISLEKIRGMERIHGDGVPLLVHTDLELTDAELRTVAPSFWQYGGYEPDLMKRFGYCAVSNVFTGSTMLFNRACRDRSLPAHPEAPMHDWWVALVATKYGYADNIKEATVKYRQHGGNVESAGKEDSVVCSLHRLLHIMDKYRRHRGMFKSLGYGYIRGSYYKIRHVLHRISNK